MKTVNVTAARNDIYNIINQTIVSSEPVQITSKNGDVIMLSLKDWEAIQETLNLVSIPGMKESILEGKKEAVEDCETLEDIGWNLK
ncbi:type II toxin-antitoxin system Phd/YefM family antitoxin [Clostridium luticellarii]|jgi:prevent-host-death family protein|uniref:Antitoxin n=1 Tax=Clostridium luticellarii TaxID=1691940 RepID=A0A2T0BMS6_9CLOT|nr:type II toxin-antitoxin system Phd/YefM family antitoxin [Clostridium luticellarii]MCI1944029.1 type II toxin-antitoxin system Phd/YefM family antitoxin [Clostridium luticellarii]MCI1967329.1 type II toxin-antitoxin system Phd/YefM family antitoxin [Clostridium luticellarii]MCI1995520.1 type II toxin-antitoxin system Phd/YefM family antitoxin [Clostridium luticellarii]MCI2039185.1 type II toxin-antitoxin system Phd/YefM family antitoxin [Clostridium luticellarii]PRR85185.1 Antitoxin RelJ [C